MSIAEQHASRSVEARHTINATAEEVFDAWVKPELIEAWWGPEGFTTVVRELEAREGGKFWFEMTSSSGAVSGVAGFYREIDRPERLEFEFTEHCTADLPDEVASPDERSFVTVEFKARGAQTEVVITHTGLSADYGELAGWGWSSSLEKLGGTLGGRA